jgi:hypothetical protein
VAAVVAALGRRLKGPEEQGLRRAFLAWIEGSLLPARKWQEVPELGRLQEARSMLAETVEKWFRDAERKGRKRGLEKGLRQGHQEGLRAGEARLLLRQAEQRFGPLSPADRARIEAADADRLLRWGERVLGATSLEEMLADRP